MSPLWEIEHSNEVRNYFIDSGVYTGNLLGEIERLRYAPDGLPEANYTEFNTHFIQWQILGHLVFYRKKGQTLEILAVKPL